MKKWVKTQIDLGFIVSQIMSKYCNCMQTMMEGKVELGRDVFLSDYDVRSLFEKKGKGDIKF
jgi:hypothetical protein